MHYNDHAPPHFHAFTGAFDALVSIERLELFEGRLPPREARLVLEWARVRQHELMEN